MRLRITYLVLIAIIFSFSECGQQSKKSPLVPDNALDPDMIKNPASAEGKQKDVKLPEFSFKKEIYDFGTIKEGEKVSYSFTFENTGNADLLITDATASCGCTVPEFPKEPVPPGKSGVVNVVFDSAKKDGYQRKEIFVVANTIPNQKKLIITGTVLKKSD